MQIKISVTSILLVIGIAGNKCDLISDQFDTTDLDSYSKVDILIIGNISLL